jgi:hypothetical protein
VNTAEKKRNARIARLTDIDLARWILHDTTGDVTGGEFEAFQGMLNALCAARGSAEFRSCLTKKQRAWGEEIAKRITPLRAEDAPKGDPVVTPDVLRNLPKFPPGRVPR